MTEENLVEEQEQTAEEEQDQKVVKKFKFFTHLKTIGFSNRLAIYILIFLLLGLLGGFYLALKSIDTGYMGQLLCWTVVFTPLGTAVSIVLSRIVDKSKAENVGGNGDGIKYAAMMNEFKANSEEDVKDLNSPPI